MFSQEYYEGRGPARAREVPARGGDPTSVPATFGGGWHAFSSIRALSRPRIVRHQQRLREAGLTAAAATRPLLQPRTHFQPPDPQPPVLLSCKLTPPLVSTCAGGELGYAGGAPARLRAV